MGGRKVRASLAQAADEQAVCRDEADAVAQRARSALGVVPIVIERR